jgi:hypothetical protein
VEKIEDREIGPVSGCQRSEILTIGFLQVDSVAENMKSQFLFGGKAIEDVFDMSSIGAVQHIMNHKVNVLTAYESGSSFIAPLDDEVAQKLDES